MADLKPETGLVFRYDFVFREEHAQGIDSGKDRPCAIVVAMDQGEGQGHKILAAPITHTPPSREGDGVEIPHKLARHLGLDDERMWVKVNDLNRFTWEEGRIPFGVTPVSRNTPAYGVMPDKFHQQVIDGVRERAREKTLAITPRDDLMEDYRTQREQQPNERSRDHGMADDD